MKLLSPEDKKNLRTLCRYLQSMGLMSGLIDFEFYDVDSTSVDLEDEMPFGKKNQFFSNHYSVKIPEIVYPIIDKILSFCNDKMTVHENVDYLNYLKLEIEIDVDSEEIFATKYWGFIEAGDSEGITWDGDEYDLENIFLELRVLSPKDSELQLDFNGSGDSGYIENSFTNGVNVPTIVENFCYDQLGSNFAGWEINEGSQGNFFFDLKNKIIYLNLTHNNDVDMSNTLFEEKFSK